MKILIITSTSFYDRLDGIINELENLGHTVILPNSYDNPNIEEEAWQEGFEAHSELVKNLFKESEEKILSSDAVLCVNLDKHNTKNYIGGAVFIELYEAFKNGKKLYLYHDIPNNILYDEIAAFNPTIIHEDLNLIQKPLEMTLKNK